MTTELDPTKPTIALVEWIRGDRRMSTCLNNAGLGITGYGFKERVELKYAPGEVITEERVLNATRRMIDLSDEQKTEFVISCPKVIKIYQ